MSLNLIEVENGKKPEEEFVILQATAKMNLKGYAIVDRTFSPKGKISNEFRHIFIFPDLVVEKDDFITLCTGTGNYDGKTDLENGYFAHVLYWNSKECVWNDNGGDCASLISYIPLKFKDVPPVEK